MCMTEKKGPLSGLGHDHMHHGEHHMEHHGEHHMERHMECCGQSSFPLIGDKLPSIQVKDHPGHDQSARRLPGQVAGPFQPSG